MQSEKFVDYFEGVFKRFRFADLDSHGFCIATAASVIAKLQFHDVCHREVGHKLSQHVDMFQDERLYVMRIVLALKFGKNPRFSERAAPDQAIACPRCRRWQ